MTIKQILKNAESAADKAAEASLDVPETATEFLRLSRMPARLVVRQEVDAFVLGRVALDFQRYIRCAMHNQLAAAVAEKVKVQHVESHVEPYGRGVHVYEGEVFVFTRDELVDLIEDAMRAGRLTP